MPSRTNPDPLLGDILDSIKAPDTSWPNTIAAPVLPLLIGAAAGIIEARALWSASTRKATPKRIRPKRNPLTNWTAETLGPQFVAAISTHGVRWAQSSSLRMWATGFFVNKAEGNLMLAMDKTINVWMGTVLGLELNTMNVTSPRSNGIEALFGLDPVARLHIVAASVGSDTGHLVTQMRDALERHSDPDHVAKSLEAWRRSLEKRSPTPSIVDIYGDVLEDVTDEEALAMIYGRFAGFKVFKDTNPDRLGLEYPIEIALTCKALKAASKLWRAMLHAVADQDVFRETSRRMSESARGQRLHGSTA